MCISWLDAADFDEFYAAMCAIFNIGVNSADKAIERPLFEMGDNVAIRSDGGIVAIGTCHPRTLRILGDRVKVGGLTNLGVEKSQRGKGYFAALMGEFLPSLAGRGYEHAILFTEHRKLYEQFGFGVLEERYRATMNGEVISRLLEYSASPTLFEIGIPQDIHRIYGRLLTSKDGLFERTPEWWKRLGHVSSYAPSGFGPSMAAMLDTQRGYALYQVGLRNGGVSIAIQEVVAESVADQLCLLVALTHKYRPTQISWKRVPPEFRESFPRIEGHTKPYGYTYARRLNVDGAPRKKISSPHSDGLAEVIDPLLVSNDDFWPARNECGTNSDQMHYRPEKRFFTEVPNPADPPVCGVAGVEELRPTIEPNADLFRFWTPEAF